jgi:hypothetical protein
MAKCNGTYTETFKKRKAYTEKCPRRETCAYFLNDDGQELLPQDKYLAITMSCKSYKPKD